MGLSFFDPKGAIALAERNLLILAVCVMLFAVIPAYVLLFTFARRYRAKNKNKYERNPKHPIWVEILCWAIPASVIFSLAFVNWNTTHALDPYKPIASAATPINVQVIALRWKFLFIYPDFGIATINLLEFPKDTPLDLSLTSDGLMNSFWVPQLGGQIFAMPAMSTQFHLIANQMGDFRGSNTEINGAGFSGMDFTARVVSDNDFSAWVANVKQSGTTLNAVSFASLETPSESNPISYYASVDPNLYNNTLMSFMMPPTPSNGSGSEAMPMMPGMPQYP